MTLLEQLFKHNVDKLLEAGSLKPTTKLTQIRPETCTVEFEWVVADNDVEYVRALAKVSDPKKIVLAAMVPGPGLVAHFSLETWKEMLEM
jgi:hypothetical protein